MRNRRKTEKSRRMDEEEVVVVVVATVVDEEDEEENVEGEDSCKLLGSFLESVLGSSWSPLPWLRAFVGKRKSHGRAFRAI